MPTMSSNPISPDAARPVAGTVYLVGAGPGDPDLLTIRAARLIERADVIVHDGLVGGGVLDMAPPTAQLISVAKKRNRHSVPQEGINALLVSHAKAGRNVVRLKGGDPFVFGRGGEELEACRVAGITVEVVPGISAALGCAAAANLPLTHRDVASAVTFVAGQCKGLSDQNWAGLAGPGRTLVIYMGVATAEDIADKLMADGLSPDTPVVVLENGTLPEQRALRTLLADLGDMVHREVVRSPAVIVVGNVAGLADASDKLGNRAGGLRMLEMVKGLEGLS
ncbi:MAG: uroporphyrinogen-III C-methyltransferase [Sphingobium sp.]